MPLDYDVAIVGAGPVGLCCANLLGMQGIKCLLLEQHEGSYKLPRAQTLDDEGLRTLQSFAVAQKYLPKTRTAQGSNYYDAKRVCFAEIGPGPENYGFPKRNYMLQQELDNELLQNLDNYPAVTKSFASCLTDFQHHEDGVTLFVQQKNQDCYTVRVAYVLACDGARSAIREKLGIQMQGWTYAQDWVVLDTVDDPDQSAVSRFFCDPERPSVSIASPRGGRRYEFMLLEGEDSNQALQVEFLASLLKPFRPYDENIISRKVVYTFNARIAAKLQEQRILLLGDAAHLTPPFAGQGMNAGLRDAHNVCWKLAAVIKNIATPKILASYEAERREPIWAMIQLAVAMGEFVMPQGPKQIAVKNSLMEALERFPEVKDYLFEMKFKPKPRYSQGFFIDLHKQDFIASLVGEMIPQPWLVDTEQQPFRLDDLLGPGFALLAQDAAGEHCLASLQHPIWQTLQAQKLRLYAPGETAQQNNIPVATINNAEYGRPLRTHRDQILVIRPDRYALGAFFPAQANQFAEQLERAFRLA